MPPTAFSSQCGVELATTGFSNTSRTYLDVRATEGSDRVDRRGGDAGSASGGT
jgi:hypothetical protein